MTIDRYLCEEEKVLNVRIIKRNEKLVVDPEAIRADYTYRIVDTGSEELTDEDFPCKKRIKIMECADDHAKVKIIGPSLDEIV